MLHGSQVDEDYLVSHYENNAGSTLLGMGVVVISEISISPSRQERCGRAQMFTSYGLEAERNVPALIDFLLLCHPDSQVWPHSGRALLTWLILSGKCPHGYTSALY